jgi:hypothetical protein
LPPKAEENEVVPGEKGIDKLRYYGVSVADDSWEELLASSELPDQVRPHLLLHRESAITGGSQLTDGLGMALGHLRSTLLMLKPILPGAWGRAEWGMID